MIILGCGYLGTALARQALAEGQAVSALTRNPARAAELRALGAAPVVAADLAGDDWHAALDPSGEIIINCVSPAGSGAEGYRHSFIEGAHSIARWLEKSAKAGRAPAREALFTSSTGVYPQTDGGWVDEAAVPPAEMLSQAGRVLLEAEKLWLALSPRQVRRAWVLRLGGLYGPGRHHLLDALRSGEKTFPGGGGHWVNLLCLDDAVSAIFASVAATPGLSGGIFNVVDDEPVLKRDLVFWLAEHLGQSTTEIQFDAANATRSSHRRAASGHTPHRRIANLRIKNAIGWRPLSPSFRVGYERIIKENPGRSS